MTLRDHLKGPVMNSVTLDHVVVDARDRLDEAQHIFQSLGFNLTPRGFHTLGSMNHLAMFGDNYLDLLGFGESGAIRPELETFPTGLNGLVFKTDNAEANFRAATAAGLAPQPVKSFSRPVEVDGQRLDACFRTTNLPPDASGIGRVYFCEHQTPELVWRPEYQAHPNGAQQIVGVLIAARAPQRQAAFFRALFGADAVVSEQDGSFSLPLSGGGAVVIAPVDAALAALGDAAPDPAGRESFMAALTIAVSISEGRVVPAAAACNTTLRFVSR
jgi:hypothetical protein